jgi:hypothetical protein
MLILFCIILYVIKYWDKAQPMLMLGCSQGSRSGAPGKPWIRAEGVGEQSEPCTIGMGSRLVYIVGREWCTVICSWLKLLRKNLHKQPLSFRLHSHSLFGCFSGIWCFPYGFWAGYLSGIVTEAYWCAFSECQGEKCLRECEKKIVNIEKLIFWRPDCYNFSPYFTFTFTFQLLLM